MALTPAGKNEKIIADVTPGLTLPVLKISMYEYILRQIEDDGFHEAAEHLSKALHLRPHIGAPRDSLFSMYERALFDPLLLKRWLAQQRRPSNVPPLSAVWDLVLCPPSGDVEMEHPERQNETTDGIPIEFVQTQLEYDEKYKQSPWTLEWTPMKLLSTAAGKNVLDFRQRKPQQLSNGLQYQLSPEAEPLPEEFRMDVSGVKKSETPAFHQVPRVSELWSTAHKRTCMALAFAKGGRLAASGGADQAVRVVVTGEPREEASGMLTDTSGSAARPGLRLWTRVFQDHTGPITALAFNPDNSLLFSGALDRTVRVYEISKQQYRRACHTLRDSSSILCLNVHPSGTMLYVGTTDSNIRSYDTRTLQCYSTINPNHNHTAAVTDICSSLDGSVFFSSSTDGSVRGWDGIANRLVNKMPLCHSGMEVNSIRLSQNQRYLLSAGSDGKARIWDIRKGQQVQILTCSSLPLASSGKCKAVFLSDDNSVISIAENGEHHDLRVHDAYTGQIIGDLKHHPSKVLNIEASTESMHLLTACEDFRCRCLFFAPDNQTEP